MPIFSIVIFIISLVDEFNDWKTCSPEELAAATCIMSGRQMDGWTTGTYIGALIIWLLPILIVFVLALFPLKTQENLDSLVEYQYGIKFKECSKSKFEQIVCNEREYDICNQQVYNIRCYDNAVRAWKIKEAVRTLVLAKKLGLNKKPQNAVSSTVELPAQNKAVEQPAQDKA